MTIVEQLDKFVFVVFVFIFLSVLLFRVHIKMKIVTYVHCVMYCNFLKCMFQYSIQLSWNSKPKFFFPYIPKRKICEWNLESYCVTVIHDHLYRGFCCSHIFTLIGNCTKCLGFCSAQHDNVIPLLHGGWMKVTIKQSA